MASYVIETPIFVFLAAILLRHYFQWRVMRRRSQRGLSLLLLIGGVGVVTSLEGLGIALTKDMQTGGTIVLLGLLVILIVNLCV